MDESCISDRASLPLYDHLKHLRINRGGLARGHLVYLALILGDTFW